MSSHTEPLRLLSISGSAREGSLNRRLADVASKQAQALGAHTTSVDLAELDLPLFHPDWSARHGVPAGALKLRELFATHHGLLLACPEYNALPTPLLINAFDWLSVLPADEHAGLPAGSGPTGVTAGVPVGLLAASPGNLGGLRALPVVRTFLSTNFAMLVVPEQVGLPGANEAFDDEGRLRKPELASLVERLVASVVRQARWRQQHAAQAT